MDDSKRIAALMAAPLGMILGGLVWGITGSHSAGNWTFGAVVVCLSCAFFIRLAVRAELERQSNG